MPRVVNPLQKHLLLTQRGGDWLANFHPGDLEAARLLVSGLTLVSLSAFARRIEEFIRAHGESTKVVCVKLCKNDCREHIKCPRLCEISVILAVERLLADLVSRKIHSQSVTLEPVSPKFRQDCVIPSHVALARSKFPEFSLSLGHRFLLPTHS